MKYRVPSYVVQAKMVDPPFMEFNGYLAFEEATYQPIYYYKTPTLTTYPVFDWCPHRLSYLIEYSPTNGLPCIWSNGIYYQTANRMGVWEWEFDQNSCKLLKECTLLEAIIDSSKHREFIPFELILEDPAFHVMGMEILTPLRLPHEIILQPHA